MEYIDKLAWIEIKNGKVLSTKSFGKIKYYLPGGKREKGETDQEALIREIQEELSVVLEPESISYVGTFEAQADGHPEGIKVKMTCYYASYTGEIKANSEIESVEWLNYSDKHKTSAVDNIIFDYLNENGLFN